MYLFANKSLSLLDDEQEGNHFLYHCGMVVVLIPPCAHGILK